MLSAAGCTTDPVKAKARYAHPGESSQLSNLDPCASRLHDICGPLLLYYATNHHLPDSLHELRQVAGFDEVEYRCPVSGLPYVYTSRGMPAPNQPGGRIIIYDAAASHQGLRWAVSIVEPVENPGGALITKVLAVPDSYFSKSQ